MDDYMKLLVKKLKLVYDNPNPKRHFIGEFLKSRMKAKNYNNFYQQRWRFLHGHLKLSDAEIELINLKYYLACVYSMRLDKAVYNNYEGPKPGLESELEYLVYKIPKNDSE